MPPMERGGNSYVGKILCRFPALTVSAILHITFATRQITTKYYKPLFSLLYIFTPHENGHIKGPQCSARACELAEPIPTQFAYKHGQRVTQIDARRTFSVPETFVNEVVANIPILPFTLRQSSVEAEKSHVMSFGKGSRYLSRA